MFINFAYNRMSVLVKTQVNTLLTTELQPQPLLTYTADADCVSFQVSSSLTQKLSCDRIAQLETGPSNLIQQQLHNEKDDNRKERLCSTLNHMICFSLLASIYSDHMK